MAQGHEHSVVFIDAVVISSLLSRVTYYYTIVQSASTDLVGFPINGTT